MAANIKIVIFSLFTVNIQLLQLTLSDESSKPRPQGSMGNCNSDCQFASVY